jgi:3-deoxy-manno-octulosonate cytidylyltransferase (CMP-KDO synthetase)
MTKTAILIPARFNSTRFPGKPLVDLGGVTMIRRVYNACKASGLPTYVLTDDMRIFEEFGPRICWIDQDQEYENGTARCAGAVSNDMFTKYLGHYEQFINVQGDMPDVTLKMIETTKWHLQHYNITTMAAKMPKEQQEDPNTVKLIRAADKALWFGRGMTGYGDWHLGIYGYTRNALKLYNTLAIPQEEHIESLEQLRWLKSGWDIGVLLTEFNGIEINTPQDAERWNNEKH